MSAHRRDGGARLRALLLAFAVLVCVAPSVLAVAHPADRFSHDSWAYYDLAQSVFRDFYRPYATRSFDVVGGYSTSFPMLWPVVIAVIDRATGLGVRTQIVAAIACAFASLVPIGVILRALVRRRRVASLAALTVWIGLLAFPGYQSELLAGRSMPLSILLLFSAPAVIVQSRTSTRSVGLTFIAGALLGLACLTRFDALPVAVLLVLGTLVSSGSRWTSRAALIGGLVLGVLPWVRYSEQHYHRLWVSDNSRVAIAAHPMTLRQYEPAATESVLSNPRDWLARVARNARHVALAVVAALPTFFFAAAVLTVSLAVAVRDGCMRPPSASPDRTLTLMGFASVFGLSAQVVTGYVEARYFTLVLATGALSAAVFLFRRVRARRTLDLLCASAVIAACTGVAQVHAWPPEPPLVSDADLASLRARFASDVVLMDREVCEQTGVRAKIHIVCAPTNWSQLTDAERNGFVERLEITRIESSR